MISQKQQLTKNLTMDDIKEFIRSSNLSLTDLRVLDVCIKEKKTSIISNGLESFEPSECLAVSNIRGKEYLYLHKRIEGKMVSRVVKETDLSELNFEAVKISATARKLLQEKYNLDIP